MTVQEMYEIEKETTKIHIYMIELALEFQFDTQEGIEMWLRSQGSNAKVVEE